MENYESPYEDGYLLPGEEKNPIWNDLDEFFRDSTDDFFEV